MVTGEVFFPPTPSPKSPLRKKGPRDHIPQTCLQEQIGPAQGWTVAAVECGVQLPWEGPAAAPAPPDPPGPPLSSLPPPRGASGQWLRTGLLLQEPFARGQPRSLAETLLTEADGGSSHPPSSVSFRGDSPAP